MRGSLLSTGNEPVTTFAISFDVTIEIIGLRWHCWSWDKSSLFIVHHLFDSGLSTYVLAKNLWWCSSEVELVCTNPTEPVLRVIIVCHDHRFFTVMALVRGTIFLHPTPTNLISIPPAVADHDLVMTMALTRWRMQDTYGCGADPTVEATNLQEVNSLPLSCCYRHFSSSGLSLLVILLLFTIVH